MIKRQRTEKSKYKHTSTGDYCTCAAYIAELMCLRLANHKKISGLPFKFWNVKPWDWTFKRQMMLANKLIKEYGEIVLVKSLNSGELKDIFSLSHPKVKQVLDRNKLSKHEIAIEPIETKIDTAATTIRSTSFGKKSQLSKLRQLDGKNIKKD